MALSNCWTAGPWCYLQQVQTYASYVQLGIVMFSALPSIIITLFMGGWSDKVGRRPTLILPVLGSVLDAAGVLIVMIFELPIYCLFVGALLHGLCGYYTTIILACLSYIADTTDQTQIALRLGKWTSLCLSGQQCLVTVSQCHIHTNPEFFWNRICTYIIFYTNWPPLYKKPVSPLT